MFDLCILCLFLCYGDHRGLHVRTHSFPTRRSSDLTTPGVARIETTPQNAAGVRRLPPVSEPEQIGTISAASATAEPPDEPPQVRAVSKGLRDRKSTRLNSSH